MLPVRVTEGLRNFDADVSERPGPDWDDYVATHPRASVYHHSGWSQVLRETFRQEAWFLDLRDASGKLAGVLPMIRQPGPIIGSYMTSMPYFNYGGALADTAAGARELMERACEVARRRGCKYIEFRDTVACQGEWQVRTDKVTMILDLPPDAATLAGSIGSKLRSQVRRPDRERPATVAGGMELLDDFYDVFRRNMHSLGTPVYPRGFFAALLSRFPVQCRLVVIRSGETPMAAGFLVTAGRTMEIPWAACRDDAKQRGYNMKLYWECLSLAIASGCSRFDFGRTTVGSGTHKFKAQWGASPVQLYWHRRMLRRQESNAGGRSDDGSMRRIVAAIWKKLPLPVANIAGPMISPRLPW